MEKLKLQASNKAHKTKLATGMEAAWQKAKLNKKIGDWGHPAEVQEKILSLSSFKLQTAGHSKILSLSRKVDELNKEETKTSTAFDKMAFTSTSVQTENAECFKAFSDVHTSIVEARSKLISVYESIANEWKEIEKNEISRFLSIEEKLNRSKTDCVFLEKEGKGNESTEADEKYEMLCQDFVSQMREFEIKMEDLYEEWIARISLQEKAFYTKAVEIYSQREIKLKETLKEPECAQQ